MIDAILTIKSDCTARVVNFNKPFLVIGDDSASELSIFLPPGVPLDKLQTIADAIADALDCARVKQNEAA